METLVKKFDLDKEQIEKKTELDLYNTYKRIEKSLVDINLYNNNIKSGEIIKISLDDKTKILTLSILIYFDKYDYKFVASLNNTNILDHLRINVKAPPIEKEK